MMLRAWIARVLAAVTVGVAAVVWVPAAQAEPSCSAPRNPLATCSIEQTSTALGPGLWCPGRFGLVESGGKCVKEPDPLSWWQTILAIGAAASAAVGAYRWIDRREGHDVHGPTDDGDDSGG